MKDVKHVYVFRTSHSSLRVRVVKTNLRPPGSFTQKKGHSCNAGVHQSIEATEIYEMWLTTITGGVEKKLWIDAKKSSLSVVWWQLG